MVLSLTPVHTYTTHYFLSTVNESGGFAKIKSKVLFKGLRVCKLETGNTTRQYPKYSEEETFYNKKYIFEKNQSHILSLWLDPR